MNFREFIPIAKRTITYDSMEKLVTCSMAGMLGAYNEYHEHRRKSSKNRLTTMEIFDSMWYTAILADHFNLELDAKVASNYYEFDAHGYDTIGKIQEVIKKVVRDNNWIPDEVQKGKLEFLFSEFLYGAQKKCLQYQINFSDLLITGSEKLASRKERGVLGGSGDER